MRNALLVCLFASFFGCIRTVSPVQTVKESMVPKEVEKAVESVLSVEPEEHLDFVAKKFTARNGTISLEMEKFIVPFYGISMRLDDNNTNWGSGGYIEIRKVKDGYVYSNKVYSTIDETLINCLEFYLREYWDIFVEEGKGWLLIDTIKSFIDDEFLTAPFNDKWG